MGGRYQVKFIQPSPTSKSRKGFKLKKISSVITVDIDSFWVHKKFYAFGEGFFGLTQPRSWHLGKEVLFLELEWGSVHGIYGIRGGRPIRPPYPNQLETCQLTPSISKITVETKFLVAVFRVNQQNKSEAESPLDKVIAVLT